MSHNEQCQYKVLDRVYYVNFEELVKKVRSGSVLRNDPVKIGSAVWTDAGQIPELVKIFDENDLNHKIPEGADFQNIFTNFQVKKTNFQDRQEIENIFEKVCALHNDKPPYYICSVCENLFCKNCPAKNVDDSRICPFCGGNCRLYMGQVWKFENKKPETQYKLENEVLAEKPLDYEVVYTKLTFRDFTNALVYPFRFPIALLIGGILFAALVLGQIVTLFRGGTMLLAFLAITIVIMMLKFAVLTRCFENSSLKDGKRRSYMPNIRKFNVFEDYFSPFFTGLKSYIVAFGLFGVLASAAGIYGWFSFSDNIERIEAEMLRTGRQVNSVVNAGEQDAAMKNVREAELKTAVIKSRLNRMEAVFGSNHLAENKQFMRLLTSIMSLTIWFQMPIFFAFLFGVLFFPAVCLSNGENRFMRLKKRFIFGFKMMSAIGFDYVKIIFMAILLLLFSFAAIYGLNLLFSMLEMPVAGILSALVTGSFLIFYFWAAFSSILGTTLANKETLLEQPTGRFVN